MDLSSPERLREPEGADGLALEDLIAPVAPERFFADYWEKDYLVVERRQPGFYDRLFTFDDVDRVLHVAASCADEALLLGPPQGVSKPRVRTAVGAISRERIYRDFCDGFSFRLAGVDRFSPPLALLQAALSQRLSARISIELYLTPASTQGVTPHYDNRDVLVLQIHGAKRWHLGRPLYELPGIGLNHVSDRVPAPLVPNDSPLLAESVLLRAGDLLYLPRGFYHRPVAEEETSLHLSVVIYPVIWSGFLDRALEYVTLEDMTLRRSLPPGFAYDRQAHPAMAETFARAVQTFAGRAPFAETLGNLADEARAAETSPPDGHFASLARLPSVGADTVMELRGALCEIEAEADQVTIRCGASFVSGPRALAPALEFIRARRRFRVGDMPGPLSDQSKIVLARRLVREGLLRLAREQR